MSFVLLPPLCLVTTLADLQVQRLLLLMCLILSQITRSLHSILIVEGPWKYWWCGIRPIAISHGNMGIDSFRSIPNKPKELEFCHSFQLRGGLYEDI